MRASSLVILVASVAAMGSSHHAMVQELPKCESARVHYGPFDDGFSDRIQVSTPTHSGTQPSTGEKVFSNQHTRWLIVASPDMTKPGPWNTSVYVGEVESIHDVELRFVDEGSGGVSVSWLNEKLIFGEVWWGRIGATDFIFDVEQRKFIYREMAHFGELVQPCR